MKELFKAILERLAIYFLFFILKFVRPEIAYTVSKSLRELSEKEQKWKQ